MAAREVDFQTLAIKSVRGGGGFAFKLANRFLHGVPDLLIKLPGRDTWMWEVKKRVTLWMYPQKVYFRPDLTMLQHKFLREYEAAGGNAGVMTFVLGKRELNVVLVRYKMLMANEGHAFYRDCQPLKRGKREEILYRLLEQFE